MGFLSLFELGLLFMALGLVFNFIAAVMMLVAAFRTHPGWGYGLFFCPPLTVVFIFSHWERARKPFFRGLLSFILFCGGIGLCVLAVRTGKTGPLHAIVMGKLQPLDVSESLLTEDPAAPDTVEAPPEPAKEYIGRHVDDIVAEHGFPRVRLEAGDTIFLRFTDWEFEADRNGIVFRAAPIDPDRSN